MSEAENYLEEAEIFLKRKFSSDPKRALVPSDARDPQRPARLDQLIIPDEQRRRMPLTKDKYLVKENPSDVAWEREVRKFLRKLGLDHEHRVSASMIFEWATGLLVKDHLESGGSTVDLKRINRILKFYFGDPYMTYIAGKKVPRAYRVKIGHRIKRRRPMTLTLWAEYQQGTLDP